MGNRVAKADVRREAKVSRDFASVIPSSGVALSVVSDEA